MVVVDAASGAVGVRLRRRRHVDGGRGAHLPGGLLQRRPSFAHLDRGGGAKLISYYNETARVKSQRLSPRQTLPRREQKHGF